MTNEGKTVAPIDELLQLRARVAELERDLSEALTEKNALRERETQFQRLVENISDVIFEVDRQGRVLYFSPGGKDIWGYDREDVIGKSFTELVHPDDLGLLMERFLELSTGIEYPLTYRIKNKAGEFRWVRTKTKPRIENGVFLGASGTLIDITDQKRTEDALKTSEEIFRKTFHTIQDSVNINRLSDGKYILSNEGFTKNMGYTEAEIIGKTTIELNIWENLEDRQRMLTELRKDRVLRNFEAPFRRKDGRIFQGLMSSAMIDFDGVPHMLSVTRDITERKQAEASLKRSEEKYRLLFESAGEGILIARDERIQFANPALLEILGLPEEMLTSRPFVSFIHPDDRDMVLDRHKRRLQGENIETGYSFRVLRADGTERWLKISSRIIIWEGAPASLSFVIDVTDLKQSEEALRRQKETAQRYLDIAPAIIVALDVDGRVTLMNAKGCQILECEPGQAIGKNWFDAFLPERVNEEVKRVFAQLMAGDVSSVEYFENMVITGRGHERIVRWYNSLIRDESGKITGVLSAGEDITERRRAEEEKAKLQDQLLQSQKMESVGRLAGGVAHDFNNMLGVILGHAEMALEQVDPTQPIHADLEEIRMAANRSADLTRQLLAFARKQTVSPRVLDLNETVEGMLKMLQRLIGEDIHLNWSPFTALWPARVDPTQIDQILANLCVNARDAIAGVGKVTIETGNISFDEVYCADHAGFVPGEYVLLAVSDDGCGMNKEILGNLFEPFFTTKGVGKGTGLGLAMVYGIVKQNDGFINVYSEPDQGTTFKIYLPRYIGKGQQARIEGWQEPIVRGQETLLVVEDEPAILSLSKLMLEKQGYRVLTAGTPGEAIRLAEEYAGDIHLLMTDVVMPEMNGRDLAKRILSLYPNLKRLFMSGYTANVIAHHGVLDEGVHFIQKPFSRKDLAAKVREALDRK